MIELELGMKDNHSIEIISVFLYQVCCDSMCYYCQEYAYREGK